MSTPTPKKPKIITRFIPVKFTEDPEIGLVYYRNPTLNDFMGINTFGLQVLKSANGYYIGALVQQTSKGVGTYWVPNYRDSQEYWGKREEAEKALLTGEYKVKVNP